VLVRPGVVEELPVAVALLGERVPAGDLEQVEVSLQVRNLAPVPVERRPRLSSVVRPRRFGLWTFVKGGCSVRHMSDLWWRRTVFLYELGIFGVLLVLAFLYYEVDGVKNIVPDVFQGLPVEVAWFGALGGVAIGLKGVYDHPVVEPTAPAGVEPWDNARLLWHFGRPFSGMLAGIVTYVLLKAVYPSGTPAQAVVLAAAFILGTQERRFFEFLKEVGAVIVAVPNQENGTGTNGNGGTAAGEGGNGEGANEVGDKTGGVEGNGNEA
jgi:hypothetical protein